MLRNKQSPYVPVALLDDDEAKVHLKIMGVPVAGRRTDLPEVAAAKGAEALVIAVPTAEASVVRDLAAIAGEAGLRTLILPPVDRLLGESVNLTDIRPLSEEDLLGRVQIDTDIEAIAEYLTDRRVLVTGAGGSIGSELCRQISRFAPSELIMLERDESALHAVQLSIDGRGLLDDPNLVIADIRDAQRVHEVFDQYAPEVVFHTAALKHVPLLESHPDEGHKTNVVGTQNLLEAAARTGVTRFVNISTDKAADPINVLGRTKRMAEQLTSRAAECAEGDFMSVRFGNVLGSRGSVLVAFRQQIEAGGPVTVTHRDVTRYFMTIPEAVELVIQAGAIGGGGDAFVLDMGEPVRIYEVARRLVEQAERPVEIVFTGLRPGEKLHEVLLGDDEMGAPTSHPLITRVEVPARAFADI
jgi:FlaA1/EpsC-like NDP-sugar epimerase